MTHQHTPIEYLRSLLGMLFFTLIFFLAIPFIFLLLIFSLGKATDFVIEYFAKGIARPTLAIIGIKFKRKQHGPVFTEPAVYIFNHSSTLDILTMMALGVRKIRFVAKWELQYFPFFFLAGRLTGQVFIKRQKSDKAIQTLINTYERLHQNRLSIMVAPEGSRKHEGEIGPFKKGAFRMAIDLKYPIVPIYFEGNNRLSPGGSILSKSGIITAHIYPPVNTSGWSLESLPRHIDEVRAMYLKWAGI